MGDVGCFVCDRIFGHHKFVVTCKVCLEQFHDLAHVLLHFSENSTEVLKCESSSTNAISSNGHELDVLADIGHVKVELEEVGLDELQKLDLALPGPSSNIFREETKPDSGTPNVPSERLQSPSLTSKKSKTAKANSGQRKRRKIDTEGAKPKPLKCVTCMQPFETELALTEHQRLKEKCLFCLDVMNHDRLHSHLVFDHGATLKAGSLEVPPVRDHYSLINFSCIHCDNNGKFFNIMGLKRHIWQEHDPNASFCVVEGEDFSKEKKPKDPTKRPKMPNEVCDICGKTVSRIKKHKLRAHGEKKFQCEICGYKCAEKRNLIAHNLTHGIGDVTTFKMCLVCGYENVVKSTLKKHILRMHGQAEVDRWTSYDWTKHDPEKHVFTEPKPRSFTKKKIPHGAIVKCQVCDKLCKKTSLSNHMRQCHGPKDLIFNCRFCVSTFNSMQSLQNHYKSKHRERLGEAFEHRCAECDLSFPTRNSFCLHRRKVHDCPEARLELSQIGHDRYKRIQCKPEEELPSVIPASLGAEELDNSILEACVDIGLGDSQS